MKAVLLLRDRVEFDDGTLAEMVIWQVPERVEGSAHDYKYHLFFGRAGERIVGYDNERRKGDHRHLGPRETPYTLTTVEQLVADFLSDVEQWRATNEEGHDQD
jgi:hypothetical protein